MFKNKLWNKKCVLIVREQTACDRKAISPVRIELQSVNKLQRAFQRSHV